MRFSDIQGIREIYGEIAKFNRKHPNWVLTPENIQQSILTHLKTTAEMHNGITINPRMRSVLKYDYLERSPPVTPQSLDAIMELWDD